MFRIEQQVVWGLFWDDAIRMYGSAKSRAGVLYKPTLG